MGPVAVAFSTDPHHPKLESPTTDPVQYVLPPFLDRAWATLSFALIPFLHTNTRTPPRANPLARGVDFRRGWAAYL
ncbi:hypothetical protein CGRA01v4_00317 [Colletotrichum graminicola]|nr:hypothetical protein CGRA01v4_00317 [Colletotrichum graminicola]